jgi:predicted ATPase/class 3 adenylate cyclase
MALPSGTLTFLFTDIEGSTRLWEENRVRMGKALERHDQILQHAVAESGGVVFATGGDGFAAAFLRAPDALAAAVAAQSRLQIEPWDPPLAVRMAVHTGDVQERDGDYFGPPLNRCARLMAIGHGGQVLCSGVTASLVDGQLPEGTTLRGLGAHRLRDLSEPEQVFQLVHAALRSEFPPVRSLDTYPSNLPTQSTAFIGRDTEVIEVAKALSEGRVITLCGVGGVGKTRLALQVAGHVLPQFEDGAWLVELASVGAAEAVEDSVAAALGVQPSPGGSLEQTLVDYVRNKSLLLVLDNCEHLLNAVAGFVDRAVRSAPGLTVLATSREGLAVPGEHLITVPSLEVPDPDMAVQDVLTTESVRLFTQRAQEAQSQFELTAEVGDAVAAICRRLDGIPLAIELAAARVRVMTAVEILEHLDRRFKLLTAGRRTAVSRHQTLQSTLDWSYDLLDEPERLVFRRLSVFAGDFELGAAQAVASDEELDRFEVTELIFRLVEKSLLVAQPNRDFTRYRMLETIRDYAWERLLASGESEATGQRHSHHFLALAEELGPKLCTKEEMPARARIERDLDNFRAALRWAIDAGEADTALRLVDAFFNAGSVRSPYGIVPSEAAALGEAEGHPLTAVAYASAAAALAAQGENQSAAELVEAALASAESLRGSPFHDRVLCHVFASVAMVPHLQGDMVRFIGVARTWLEMGKALGDAFETSQALNLLGSLTPDPSEGVAMCEESLDLARAGGSPSRIAYALIVLSSRVGEVDPERAEALLKEAIDAALIARNDWLDAFAAQQLSIVQAQKGDLHRAAATMVNNAERACIAGDQFAMSIALYHLASVLASLEQDDMALLLGAWCEHNSAIYSIDNPSFATITGDFVRLRASRSTSELVSLKQRAAKFDANAVVRLAREHLASL